LSYDLKFDKAKSEDDKIFIDNEITIAVEKIFPISSRNNIRVLRRNKRKDLYSTIQMQIELAGCGEFLSLKRKVLNPRFNFYLDKIIKFNFQFFGSLSFSI
jgi:hypothetical protein